MICKQCGTKTNLKNEKEAKFCQFCGHPIEASTEFAKYTRLEYYANTGDAEFEAEWGEVKNMNARQALDWLRGHPPAKYVYRIYAEWNEPDHYRRSGYQKRYKFIARGFIKRAVEEYGGKAYPQRSKLVKRVLADIGTSAFLTQEECQAAIQAELEK